MDVRIRDIQTSAGAEVLTIPTIEASNVTSLSAPPRWFRLSGADIVFVILALIVFQTARQGLLDDPGLGWHLRNIDAMLAKGGAHRRSVFRTARGRTSVQ